MFYCNTDLPIHLGTIYGCFCDTRAEWRAVTQITWPKKSEVFTIWEMTKKLPGYTSTPLWHVGALCWHHPFTELNPQTCAPVIVLMGSWLTLGLFALAWLRCIIEFHRLHCWDSLLGGFQMHGFGCGERLRGRGGEGQQILCASGSVSGRAAPPGASASARIPGPCPCPLLTSPAPLDPPA